ncbi:polyketide synthase-like protein [Xylaria telfairii]|nr:polyketide synthase-like protein [Xylaria telfairii]
MMPTPIQSEDLCFPDEKNFCLQQNDPVCIVGMACRLPGGVRSPTGLWKFLMDKRSSQGTIPPERYNVKGFYSPENDKAGTMNVDGGYFLQEDVRQFDSEFFGINNFEATYMDPQQRKLLEVVFECLENAGASLSHISGSNTGVYVGNFTQDNLLMQVRDPDDLRHYHATGTGLTMLANRISHAFNLHGPSLTLDTACSSSIYCLHLAVSALKAGECDGAIIAASNLCMSPAPHIAAMKAGMLSPTSTCHTFDASADGYARADGVDAVYLKRLSSAIQDNDTIYAIIRGTATNSNGRTPGVINPSAEFQETVVRKAYDTAGLDFSGTDYVECHGTGTELGDVVELEALSRCFSSNRSQPLKIGGAKPNFGHSEAASSLTSLIKVSLAFRHGIIPPTRGINSLNPKLKLDHHNMEVITEPQPWPRALQRASVCSFGYGGANAHAILESLSSYTATSAKPVTEAEETTQYFVLPISAASAKSLEARADDISRIAHSCEVRRLGSLTYTLGERITHMKFRSALLVALNPAVSNMDRQIELASPPVSNKADVLKLGFIFTGQGAQYPGMGKELLDHSSIFLSTIRELDEVLQRLPPQNTPNWSLEDMLRNTQENDTIHDAAKSQPVCTALQIGLINVLYSWGIRPSVAIGHSSGEIAAAYTCGLISAHQAILTAYFRGQAVSRMSTPTCGAMLACGIAPEEAKVLLEELGIHDQVFIACINAPQNVTLSGLREGIEVVQQELQARKRFCRLLETDGQAYHSPWMKAAGSTYESLLQPLFQNTPENTSSGAKMYSTAGNTDHALVPLGAATNMATYWRNNLESPVQFYPTLKKLLTKGKYHLIEIGPHSALKGPIRQTREAENLDERAIPYSHSLVRNQDANHCMKRLASILFIHGHDLEWQRINDSSRVVENRKIFQELTPYPWDYSNGLRWFEPRASNELRNRQHIRHELLGSQQIAGNGLEWTWRNLLHIDEIPWLRDHKIETQIVFPAAGYLAMAMEAMARIRATVHGGLEIPPQDDDMMFLFENVNINSALVVPDETSLDSMAIELHTTMALRRLSAKTSSTKIYDFTISSWTSGKATIHCVGSIKLSNSSFEQTVMSDSINDYRDFGMDIWYDKYDDEGMLFGPYFRTLNGVRADRKQLRSEVQCRTQIQPSKLERSAALYIVHPLTIDSCLQAAVISASQGNPDAFRAYVPVFIGECRIRRSKPYEHEEPGVINAQSSRTSFSTLQASCTLLDSGGGSIVDMKGLRLSVYTGKAAKGGETAPYLQRHPAMRVQWKPDIHLISLDFKPYLDDYIADFVQRNKPAFDNNERATIIGALLDLSGHKNPRTRVLEIGACYEHTQKQWCSLLDHETPFPRLGSWSSIHSAKITEYFSKDSGTEKFDVVIYNDDRSYGPWDISPDQLTSQVKNSNIVIGRESNSTMTALAAAGFFTLATIGQVMLAVRAFKQAVGRNVLIVGREMPMPLHGFAAYLSSFLMERGISVNAIALAQLDASNISDNLTCISLLESEEPFLATMTQDEIDKLHILTDNVKNLVWLSGCNMLRVPHPDFNLVGGLARAIMIEQPSLRFTIVDIGCLEELSSNLEPVCEAIIKVLWSREDIDDKEFVFLDGLLHVSRLEPHTAINDSFRRYSRKEQVSDGQLRLGSAGPARLAIGRVGTTDTIHFQQLREPHKAPPRGYIDVQVKAVSLNAKDIYTLSGRIETRTGTAAIELGGVVVAVGPGVDLTPGDRVLVVTPNNFSTIERVPAWTAYKLLPEEDYGVVASLPTIYCAALYAIRDRAQLRSGETILIHSGAGAFGLAAIALARRAGAIVYTTVGSTKKRDFLINLGVPDAHIFNSRDDSFADSLKELMKGRGVDVVINSLTGDLMHASWGCLAPFGRFIEVGKRELVDDGVLDMRVFSRNATFAAFDLTDMFFQNDEYYKSVVAGLVAEVLALYRSNEIQPVPLTVFDVSDITQAYRYFSSKDRIGKIIVSLENEDSSIAVSAPKYQTILSSDKVYLLVGALGGLGRSLTRWMVSRGAKRFVFLQRSGCDKPGVKEFVDSLKQDDVLLAIVKGDVTNPKDVATSIEACRTLGPLGGVVQAAMGLHEELFTRMTSEGWHKSVKPKLAGSWNLHTAIEGLDESLDFFLLMSSMNGSVGTPTESNYCAANAFLDAFAYWRRGQKKPATSLGLGMISGVGYLHENPEIEKVLLRRGIQPLSESDFIHLVDLAIHGSQQDGRIEPEDGWPAHILTGLETTGIRRYFEQGFEVSHSILSDPRASILASALEVNRSAWHSRLNGSDSASGRVALSNGSSNGSTSVRGSVTQILRKRFSDLLLTPIDQIDTMKPFTEFGIDSMIAAEFRTWLWGSFKVDVPFLDLLSPQKSLDTIAGLVEAGS